MDSMNSGGTAIDDDAVDAEARRRRPDGAVFLLDNAATRNAVIRYRRASWGWLTPAGVYPTGGLGTGAGLGSQGSVVLSADGRRLFAVNAGSDEISIFDVHRTVLVLREIAAAGGAAPISLTVRGDLLYVVNAGRGDIAGNIAGFRVAAGSLQPIAGASQPLSAAAVGPAQIELDPSGRTLVVTEKATSLLTTYAVDGSGRAGPPRVTASHGQTPFGFSFDRRGTLLVSEAFGGAAGASAVSSYRLSADGIPQLISGSVATGQTAACWLTLGGSDRAYTTNAGSDSVSGYRVDRDGSIHRFDDGGVTAAVGDAPIDLDATGDGRLLYVLDGGSDAIDILAIRSDGSLRSLGRVSGLPASTVGIAVW
jgi:6-phosphogluconolactonase (cycloisomerase 2 family)